MSSNSPIARILEAGDSATRLERLHMFMHSSPSKTIKGDTPRSLVSTSQDETIRNRALAAIDGKQIAKLIDLLVPPRAGQEFLFRAETVFDMLKGISDNHDDPKVFCGGEVGASLAQALAAFYEGDDGEPNEQATNAFSPLPIAPFCPLNAQHW